MAEGSGREGLTDQRRFAHMARGSLYEVKHWLRRAFIRKLLTSAQTKTLKATVDSLTRTLSAYISSFNRRKNAVTARPKSKP